MTTPPATILTRLYALLLERKSGDPKTSYVAQLYSEGQDRILQKVGEEAIEVVLAAKNRNREEVIRETADLWFHTLIMLAELDLHPDHIFAELERRRNKPAKGTTSAAADRREYTRRIYDQPITLQFHNGLILEGRSQDVSLNGLLVATPYEPKWQLLGESGFFDLQAGPRLHSFSFEVCRITDHCLGLTITRDRGLFAFVLSGEVFQDIFDASLPEDGFPNPGTTE